MKILLAAALLIPNLGFAQTPRGTAAPEDSSIQVSPRDSMGRVPDQKTQEPSSFTIPLFTEGMWTRYSSNMIPNGALAEALNVVLDEDVDGVVVRRRGSATCNSVEIPDGEPVEGLFTFDDDDGTRYQVAHSSESLLIHPGDCVFAPIIPPINGIDSEALVNCVQTLGRLWCVDGAKLFFWDGTSTGTVAGAPVGQIVNAFRNRVVIADISGEQSRVRLSGELDGTDWTAPGIPVSTSPANIAVGGVNDGLKVQCLMGTNGDAFLIGKEDSLFALYGFGRADFRLREISREVGCLEDRLAKEKNNCIYWLSRRGVERLCGNIIQRISDPIRDQIDVIIQTAGNIRSLTDTDQVDFEAGNLEASGPGAPLSATIFPGNIVPSTTVFLDNSTTTFSDGSFSAAGAALTGSGIVGPGAVASTYTFRYDADVVPGSDGWTGGISNDSEAVSGSTYTSTCAAANCSGQYSKAFAQDTESNTLMVIRPQFSGGTASNTQATLSLEGPSQTWATIILTTGTIIYQTRGGSSGGVNLAQQRSEGEFSTYTIIVTTFATASFWKDGVFITSGPSATSGFSPNSARFGTSIGIGDSTKFLLDFFHTAKGVVELGTEDIPTISTFTSRVFDTSFSTPTAGILSLTTTTAPNTDMAFFIHTATASTGPFTDYIQITDLLAVTATQQFYQYRTTFTQSGFTEAPSIVSFSLEAASTATFIGQCRQLVGITSFGILACSLNENNGTIDLFISTGATCNDATASTATANAQVNNTPITVSTAAFAAYRAEFTFDEAVSSTPVTLQSCTISYNEGETRPPAGAAVYRDRYHLAYTSDTASGAVNDHQLVLDRNDKWTIFDNLKCASLSVYNRNLFCGSADDGFVIQQDIGTDDSGIGFTSKIRTKAFHLGMPERRKIFKRVYWDLEPEPTASDMITLTARFIIDRGSTTFSLGTVDLGVDPDHILTTKFPFPLNQASDGRYIALEVEASGLNQPSRIFGGRLYYEPLSLE